MNRFFNKLIIAALVLLTFTGYSANKKSSNPKNKMKVRMVLFTPADVELPADYLQRYKDMADYSEVFFQKWMKHWGYDCKKPLDIERDIDGYPVIITIKGEQNKDFEGYKKLPVIRKEVMKQIEEKYKLSSKGQVWWILNYPKVKRGSRGGGNAMTGGNSFGNYIDSDEQIDRKKELAEGMHEEILLKSLIHELTHALGMGHIGPRDGEDLGNSLMGPVNRAYKKKYVNDSRVHLSEAAAAMLYKHPLFDGKNDASVLVRDVAVEGLKVKYLQNKNQFIISGKLKSEFLAHSIVVSDASKGNKSPYWHKAYVGKVKSNGTFQCVVSELNKADGELVIGFCFDNGAVTGNGKKLGLNNSGIKKQYTYTESGFQIK